MEEIKKKGNFYYSSWNEIVLRATQQHHIESIQKCLTTLSKKGLTANPKYINKILVKQIKDKRAYFFNKKIALDVSEDFHKKRKNNNRENLHLMNTLSHEIIHSIDCKNLKFEISNHFFSDYVSALEKANSEIFHESEYEITENMSKRNLLFNEVAVPQIDNERAFQYYTKHYTEIVKQKIGIPSVYSLHSPHEFVAELFSFYLTRKNSIPDKKLRKKIRLFLKNNI